MVPGAIGMIEGLNKLASKAFEAIRGERSGDSIGD